VGSRKVEDTSTSLQIVNYLNELCSYAMSLGMSYHEYWEDEPDIIKFYIDAEKLRANRRNNEMWLQGLYIYQAVGSLYPAFNPFSKEHKVKPYMKEPVPLTEEERQLQFEAKVEAYMDKLVGRKPRK
jgi:hypothetical protein